MRVIIKTRSEENGIINYTIIHKEINNIEDNNVSKIIFELANKKLELVKNANGWELVDSEYER